MRALGWLAAIALCACATPKPPPLPTPAPGALWPARVFDCHLPVVADERPAVFPEVRACMLEAAPVPCIVKLPRDSNTIACSVRRLDMDSTSHVNAGSTDPVDRRLADAARKIVTDGVWGFR